MRASPYKTAYIAAKHGLAGFTKAVAIELAADGVTSNGVSPGFVWTPLVAKQIPDLAKSGNISEDEAKRKLLARQPTGRFVTVDEVAAGGRVPRRRIGGLDQRRQLFDRRRLDGRSECGTTLRVV